MERFPLIDRMDSAIRKYSLLTKGESVLVGFSGGPDSTCLLFLLNRLKEKYCLTIHALYVNHNLRPGEIPRETAFCREFCNTQGIPFIEKSIDVAGYSRQHCLNKQEAARDLRYKVFQETAFEIGAQKIALAHNADDQVETFFMRIVRGAGPGGLAGIPVKRGAIVRPLLDIERSTIEAFLEHEKLSFVVDSSNLSQDYFRNMIRLSILPALKKNNPNLIGSVRHTMAIFREEERYFDILVTKTLMKLICRKAVKRIELFLTPLEGMDTVILRRVLRRAIQETESIRGISFVHVEDIITLIKTGKAGDRLYLPGGIRVIKAYAVLIMTSEDPVKIGEYEITPPGELALRGTGTVIRSSIEVSVSDFDKDGREAVLLDAGDMVFPLRVRPRKQGDFFYPIGFGKRKKLQDFFVDAKVPRDERDSIPVIVSGEDIIWIAGFRADERYKVTQETKKFIRLAIVKGNF